MTGTRAGSASMDDGSDCNTYGLLERGVALESIRSLIAKVRQGRGGSLFIVAEPGLGKTTILKVASEMASDVTVVSGECTEMHPGLPFGLLDELFSEFGHRELPTDLPTDGVSIDRVRALRYSKLMKWLRDDAPLPLLIAIDDLHWSDCDSLDMIALACRRLKQVAVAVVATLRPWPAEASERARVLEHDGHGAIEYLRPINSQSTRLLLESVTGSPVSIDRAEGVWRLCAGNPILLKQVAYQWQHGEENFGIASAPDAFLDRLLLPRFAGVGSNSLRYIQAASVLGTRFQPLAAGNLVGYSAPEVREATEVLFRMGLIRKAEDGNLEFVHALFRQALYHDMSPVDRVQMHGKAMRALIDRGADSANAAAHAVAGELVGDSQAISILHDAGISALAYGAISTAIEHMENARKLAGRNVPARVMIDLGLAYLSAGRLQEASNVAELVLSHPELSPQDEADARRQQMLCAMWRTVGDSATARDVELLDVELLDVELLDVELLDVELRDVELLDVELRDLEAGRESNESIYSTDDDVEALLASMFSGWFSTDADVSRRRTDSVIKLVGRMGITNDRIRVTAMATTGLAKFLRGDMSGIDDITAAIGNARSYSDFENQIAASSWIATWAFMSVAKCTERFDEAGEVYEAVLPATERNGNLVAYVVHATNQADALWRIGDLTRAGQLLESALDRGELVPTLIPYALVVSAKIQREMGRSAESMALTMRVKQMLSGDRSSPYLKLWSAYLGCQNLIDAGEFESASRAANKIEAIAEAEGFVEPCIVPWHGSAIDAYLGAGHLDRAEAVINGLAEVSCTLRCRAPKAIVEAGRACIAWMSGSMDDACAFFESAMKCHTGLPMPLAEAETALSYGRFLRRGGAIRNARGVFQKALSRLDGSGALRLETLLVNELLASGGRRRSRKASSQNLSPREIQVATLASSGNSNAAIAAQLYISAKTVDHHLTSVYAKLGIGSRHDLNADLLGRNIESGLD